MKEKKLVVSPGLTPDWLRKRNGIIKAIDEQLIMGLERPGIGLILDQLQKVVEHRNPFKEKRAGFAESVRAIQMERLRAKGYIFDEKDVPFPDVAKLQPGLALLVDYETPIDDQCQLLGIKNHLDLGCHRDLHQKPQGRWGWVYAVEDGKKMLGKAPNICIEEFGRNKRRGLMTVEGLALYRENPDLLKDHYVDFSGSRCVEFDGHVPSLCLDGGVPSLHSSWANNGSPKWGSASAEVV